MTRTRLAALATAGVVAVSAPAITAPAAVAQEDAVNSSDLSSDNPYENLTNIVMAPWMLSSYGAGQSSKVLGEEVGMQMITALAFPVMLSSWGLSFILPQENICTGLWPVPCFDEEKK